MSSGVKSIQNLFVRNGLCKNEFIATVSHTYSDCFLKIYF